MREGMLYTAHMEARGREGLMTCWGNAHDSWEREEKDIISGGQTRMARTVGAASTEQSRHEC